MTYPWAGFSTFLFLRSEIILWGSDTGWQPNVPNSRERAMFDNKDTILVEGATSSERTFECYLSPSRYDLLVTLIGTIDEFCDWERPIPDAKQVYLSSVELISIGLANDVRPGDPALETIQRRRVRISLISQ